MVSAMAPRKTGLQQKLGTCYCWCSADAISLGFVLSIFGIHHEYMYRKNPTIKETTKNLPAKFPQPKKKVETKIHDKQKTDPPKNRPMTSGEDLPANRWNKNHDPPKKTHLDVPGS